MKVKHKFRLANEILYFLVRNYSDINPKAVKLERLKNSNCYAYAVKNKIWLNPKISDEIIPAIICHEFVHLLQFHSGRLVFLNNCVMFDNVKYNYTMTYEDMPWEIEAYELQEKYKEKIL